MSGSAASTVLLGSGDPGRRESLTRHLRQAGLASIAPPTGPDVARRARQGGYRLLLLEAALPGVDPAALVEQGHAAGALALVLGRPPASADLALPAELPEAAIAAAAAALLRLARRLEESEESAVHYRNAFIEAKEQLDRTEASLTRLRQRFHRLVDANPAVIYATSAGREHRNLFVSRRLQEMLGYPPQEMIGNARFWLEHLHPAERRRVLGEMEGLLEQGRGTLYYHFRGADGEYRHIRDDFVVLRDERGRPLEVIGAWSDVTEQSRSALRLQAIFDNDPGGILLVDGQGLIREVNPALLEIFGYRQAGALLGKPLSLLLPPARRAAQEELFQHYLQKRIRRPMGKKGLTIEGLRADGTTVPLEIALAPLPEGVEEGRLVLAIVRDITEKRAAEARVEDLLRAYQMLSGVNRATVGCDERGLLLDTVCRIAVEAGGYRLAWIGLLDAEGHWLEPVAAAGATGYLEGVRVSARAEEPEGRGPSGRALRSGDAVIMDDTEQDPDYAPWRERALRHGLKASIALPLVVEGRIAGTLNLYADSAARFSSEELALLSEVAGDVAFGMERIGREQRRRAAEARLRELVWHDPLTGLLNRAGLLQAAGDLLEESGGVALVLFDLARLREVNQSLGYPRGDRLLQALAARLSRAIEGGERAAHLGASVFGLLLPGPSGEPAAVARAAALLQPLERPFLVRGLQIPVQLRAGVALAPRDGRDPELLLRRADLARASVRPGAGIGRFHPELEPDPAAQSLLARLMETMGSGHYRLHYQPKMALGSGRIEAVEALVRWRDPEGGLLPPGRFLPLLERTGLMTRLTPHLLAEAAAARARWLAQGLELEVAVNIAADDLAGRDLPAMVLRACGQAGIEPSGLLLELTETSVLQETPVVTENLERLNGMGVKLAIDDFGTGHASLSRLVDLPVQQIKVDQHFVMQMLASVEARMVVESSLAMAYRLDLEVVAEGVEDAATLAALRELGCQYIQGYAISRPLPEAELLAWLQARS